MATLFNTKISDTYEGLIKTSDNGVIGAVEQNLTDGSGNASTLSIGTSSASFTGTLDLTNATVVGLPSGGNVDSVNGQTGVVVLTTTNIAEGTNLYFTDARVEANSAVTLNTAKVGITTAQANEISANTLKVGITTSQASDITANNAKVTFPEAPNDGQQYARQSQGWSVVTGGGGGGAVDSVNGQTGTVVLDTDNINEGTTNLYYTETRVNANSSVVANTAKVGITSQQATDITTNNAKVGITTSQANEIAANTLKVGITPTQASDITTNNAKVGITTQQASDITTNTAKVGITTAQANEIAANTIKVGITTQQATAITDNTAKNSYPTVDADKLAGIETGAEVNDVDSVNGLTGAVSLGLLDLDDVGADGISGQVLTTNGSGAFTFTTVSSGGGGVSSVTGTGSVSGLTLTTGGTSANPILTLGGTLSLTSANVTDALTFTPYNSTNPDNFISSYTVTNSDVTTALGFTPYNNTNPSNFTSNLGIVQSVTGNTGTLQIVNGVLNVPPSAGAPVDSVNGEVGTVVLDTDDIAEGTTNKYMVLGTSASTALAGNTSLLQLGLTSTTALAGDTTTISGLQATAITDNSAKVGFTQALVSVNTDVTNNTAKVGNVQSDWSATSGLAVILNKPSIPSAAPVDSVNGEIGTVVLDTSDIAENTNLYFTDARVSSNSAVTLNTAKVGITSAQAADITDNNTKVSMVLGTTAGTALEGDTALLQLGTTSTTALAGNTNLLQLGLTSTTALAGDTTVISAQQATDIANNTTKLNNIEAGAEVNTIDSSVSGEPTGSDQVLNLVSLTQAEYDAGTPVATTLYIIT